MKQVIKAGHLKLGVLASGRGSNFDAICQAIDNKNLDAEITVLISDQEDALVLQKAKLRNIKSLYINYKEFSSRDAYEEIVVEKLKENNVDIVVLAGYMRLVGRVFLKAFPHRILNIHPALLPAFPGLHAQRQAVEYGVKVSGCTVHIVDEGMDTGPIIMQEVVPVFQDDDENTLAQRIIVKEHQIYWRSLQLVAEGRVWIDGRKVIIKDND
jgi:phosphoribosylglycinamide formyltransferase-1